MGDAKYPGMERYTPGEIVRKRCICILRNQCSISLLTANGGGGGGGGGGGVVLVMVVMVVVGGMVVCVC